MPPKVDAGEVQRRQARGMNYRERGDVSIAGMRLPFFIGVAEHLRPRASSSQRSDDKFALSCAAAIRLVPAWNSLKYWPTLQDYLGVEWLQFVPVVEVGRVAPV